MTVPVSTASAERSFSALRRLKTYLRSSMSQEKLNHVMVMHCHKDKTDSLNMVSVARDFVSKHDSRRSYFGVFEDEPLLE